MYFLYACDTLRVGRTLAHYREEQHMSYADDTKNACFPTNDSSAKDSLLGVDHEIAQVRKQLAAAQARRMDILMPVLEQELTRQADLEIQCSQLYGFLSRYKVVHLYAPLGIILTIHEATDLLHYAVTQGKAVLAVDAEQGIDEAFCSLPMYERIKHKL